MLCIAGERPVLGELANTRFRTRHRRRRDRRPCRIPPGGGTAPQKRLEPTLHAPGTQMMLEVMKKFGHGGGGGEKAARGGWSRYRVAELVSDYPKWGPSYPILEPIGW